MAEHAPALTRLMGRIEAARAAGSALLIRGGGTKLFYGEASNGEPLDVTELRGVTSYEPTELVVTARAGTPIEELEAALQECGQCLPFEPPRFAPGGTVGGMVAAGLSGPARASAGSLRDHVLGMTVLNGRAEVLSFGGQVAKNVAGYDASRLMTGSLGVLGVICEVSLKVLPVAPATATVTFDWDQQRALAQLKAWASHPLPLNAIAWHEDRLTVRLSGACAAVADSCDQFGGTLMAEDAASVWWNGVRDHVQPFFRLSEADFARGEALWRLSVPATTAALALPGRQFLEWRGAQRWLRTTATAREVRGVAARAGGHATLMRGNDRSAGVFHPLNDVLMRIHHGLKQTFDPARVFNPGRLYAEL